MKAILLTICMAATLSAAATLPPDTILSLDQCKQMALMNNTAMQRAANDAESAKQQRKEAFTKYFPEISAAGGGFWANTCVLQYNVLDLLKLELIKHGVTAGVQLLQPIFMGGQIINGNQLAKVGEAVAQLRREQTSQEVLLTVEKYYWQLATLHSTRRTLTSAIQMLDTLQHQVQVAVDAGVMLRNDLLKVELKRNDYRAEMVDLNNGINLCRMVLSQYIGEDFDRPIDIDEPEQLIVPEYPTALRIDPTEALPNTLDFQLLNANVKAKRLEKRMEVGKNLPMVVGGAGWYYHNLLEQRNNFGALSIAINVPISGWWGGSHAIKRKDIELKNAELERDDLCQMLQIDMQNKWDELTAAHRKMQIAHEAIAQANENLRLNRLYYSAGTATITDLLDAETLQRQALDSFTKSLGDFRLARAAYLFATGR